MKSWLPIPCWCCHSSGKCHPHEWDELKCTVHSAVISLGYSKSNIFIIIKWLLKKYLELYNEKIIHHVTNCTTRKYDYDAMCSKLKKEIGYTEQPTVCTLSNKQ